MFTRIRYAAHVIAYSTPKADPYTEPDVVFEEAETSGVSDISYRISNAIGFLGVALAFGFLSAFILKRLPVIKSTVAVGVFAILLAQTWHYISRVIQDRVHTALRFGDRMGPYFGHKLTRAIRILRS